MRCDVLVIGGGPVGCIAATSLAQSLDVKVLEEHPRVGEPVQCAGLVTPRVVELASANDTIINHINGACLHFPGGRTLSLQGEEVKAVVVDRGEFDRRCSERAIKAGAEVLTSHRCLSVKRSADGITASLSDGNVDCRALLAADGFRSNAASQLGLGRAKEVVRGIEVDLRMKADDQHCAQVFLGRKVAPGFFAWAIPCGDLTRVGLCISPENGTPQKFLNELLQMNEWNDAERVRTYSGVIPLGHLKHTYADNVLIAGDAAGMAKPLSGGGLFTGMTAGRMAADVLKEAFQSNDLSAKRLSDYERQWKLVFGNELRRSYRVRRVFASMTDRDLDNVGGKLDRESVTRILATGDIDYPTALAPRVLKASPSLLAFSPLLLLRLLRR
ncbi:MAG TPA: NAD(P)/FAD-dependent oxidoreductase [Methanomassiliicoccales archaeon]|nr:NAD(P)/FAD-dependent oxidoreductase [Methanomassiliicoccales archaeon]